MWPQPKTTPEQALKGEGCFQVTELDRESSVFIGMQKCPALIRLNSYLASSEKLPGLQRRRNNTANEENQSIETDSEMTRMKKFIGKDIDAFL